MDASPSMSSSTTSPDPDLMDVSPRRPIALRSAEPSLVRSLLPKGIDTCTSTSGERPRKPLRRCGASTTICSPRSSTRTSSASLPLTSTVVVPTSSVWIVRAPEPSSTYSDAGPGSRRSSAWLLQGVFVRPPARRRSVAGEVWRLTQPVIRLGPRPRPNGSPGPNGRLLRSMSTLMARSRVAARTTLTIQLLSECPPFAASSSALYFSDSGMRSVIRATASSPSTSSRSSGDGGVGGIGGSGADGIAIVGTSTTSWGSRPRSRTSTEPAGSSLVISAAACDSASMSARRTAGSSARVRRSARPSPRDRRPRRPR